MTGDDEDLVARLRRAGVARGDLVGLVVSADLALGLAPASGGWVVPAGAGAGAALARADEELRPRWAVWSGETAARLVSCGVRLATCWDIGAGHRLLFGGWRADPGFAWARLQGLAAESVPAAGPPDLFGLFGVYEVPGATGDGIGVGAGDDPVAPDGYLRPEWTSGGWADSAGRLGAWAELARTVASGQQDRLAALAERPMAVPTARSESTAELLCAELCADGLPMDRSLAEGVLASIIGPRPRSDTEAVALRAARDEQVLRHAPPGVAADLRSPAQVRTLLGRIGVDVPDTRAWRLRELHDAHPLVAALLEWRKAERIATTYGYAWLDEALGPDGRLRGAWTGSDGAAGRMTASAGLHNMPAAMRPAVVAGEGHAFVRADLGQIEPRVLAAVTGDQALVLAAREDDMYAPVAAQLRVDRPTAKVAVLGAMYGQTTGYGAQALRRLNAAYPVAMGYLDAADRAGQAGRDLRTYGGRLVQLAVQAGGEPRSASRAAAYGRYARNAMIQGAAAELFKMWAVTVRARCGHLGARIVLCLHDELLVHAPVQYAETVAGIVDDCLHEAARRWAPGCGVRFVSDTTVVSCWSDAKGSPPPPMPPGRRVPA
ncbi:MAG: DNA polymerase [Streptosporangiaceae bacterium]